MYARLLRDLEAEYHKDGVVRSLLRNSSNRPIHDATPLRLLGTLHRQVLEGRLPQLASFYPSTGGDSSLYRFDVVKDAMHTTRELLREGLGRQVQTNEVGRSVVHLSLAQWLGNNGISEFDLFEIGASAGLNLCFAEFSAETGEGTMGAASSPVTFAPSWFLSPPPLRCPSARVNRTRGCDPFPIDVGATGGAHTLMSFVWPDQTERLRRLEAAIDIARRERPVVDLASADEWLATLLVEPLERTTVIFHSIVWQYLSPEVQTRVKQILTSAGTRTDSTHALIWARMEPAGPVADIQVDIWNGSPTPQHGRLATVGYHGHSLEWNAEAADRLRFTD